LSAVPYVVQTSPNDAEYNRELAESVNEAVRRFNQASCIPFVPRDERVPQRDYVVFFFANICTINYGRSGGPQKFPIGAECGTVRHILQHLVLVLGILRESSRIDRDEHITVHLDNVLDRYKFKFYTKFDPTYVDQNGDVIDDYDVLKEDYDYASITHFASNEFAKNGSTTVVSKRTKVKQLGSINLEFR
jgi:hypothetical protein